MRIVVLTKHYVKNYGSVLQTLATQEVLGSITDEVIIGNYIRPEAVGTNFINAVLKNRKRNRIKDVAYKVILYPTIVRWEKIFGEFVKTNINVSEPVCYSSEELFETLPKGDVYCTGSDMVWNDETNGGFLPAYFLEFVPDGVKKISFASSFGKESFSEEQNRILHSKLKSYDAISVRENSAVKVIEHLGLSAKNVLDPSLCVDRDYWKKCVAHNKYGDYLLVYQLTSNKQFDDYAKKLAKKYGVKLIRICTRYDNLTKPGIPVLLPTVEQWITLFWHAKYIVTDSFHGTAFSINLNKEVVTLPPRQYESRLRSIMEVLKIDRYRNNYEDMSIFDVPIDYTAVNSRLNEERKFTIDFLRKAIGVEMDR